MASEAGKSATAVAERPRRPRPAKAPYHKGNVRSSLIEAARRLMATETIEAITARRLCREVNVSSANFYNHFSNLEDLFLEVAAEGFAQRAAENQRILKRGGSREEMLIQIAQNLVEFSIADSQLFRLMFGQIGDVGANVRYAAAADESFRVIAEIVMGKDSYRADDLELSHETCQPAYAFFAFIYGLARCLSQGLISNPSGTRAERRRFVEALTRQMIKGVDLH